MKVPELLAPAGTFDTLKTAIHYGAEAVYLGKSSLSLRYAKEGFATDEDIARAIDYAHKRHVKVYVTINIFAHNRDLDAIASHIAFLNQVGPDGIILSDLGVFNMAKALASKIPIHISTQANTTNIEAIKFWKSLGAKRINLARELSLDELAEIRSSASDIELEVFVHGAICISYSGRCYLSAFLTNRSANAGLCTNSCRWKYFLVEEKRPGQYFPVFEDNRGTYIMNSKDLCLIDYIPSLIDLGIDSFKIEGRTKNINYVAGVVHTYRRAIDAVMEGKPYERDRYLRELIAFSSRGYTSGFIKGTIDHNDLNFEGRQDIMEQELVGVILERYEDCALVEVKGPIKRGMKLFFLSPGIEDKPFIVDQILTKELEEIDFAPSGTRIILPVPPQARAMDIIRREKV